MGRQKRTSDGGHDARGRRGHGHGSVHQDKTGQWWAQIRVAPRKYRRARCDSEKDAQQTLTRWLKEQEAGLNLRAARLSLEDFATRWLQGKVDAEEINARTQEFYNRHLGYALPHLGHLALEDLEPQHWRDTRVQLLRGGLSRRSVNHIQTVLQTCLEQAVTDGALLSNPMKRVDKLSLGKDKFEARVLTPEEITALERACAGERLGIMLLFILAHGIRHGEARNLKRANVDLERRLFLVRDAKTRAGVRRIDLTDHWVALLRAHYARVDAERETSERRAREAAAAASAKGQPIPLASRRWRDHDLVFPSEAGTVLGEQNVTKVKQRIVQKAGLCDPCTACRQTGQILGEDGTPEACPACVGRGVILWKIRIHDLRHTAITDWIAEGGADPKTAQGMAGHSSASTTMDIYAKTRDSKQRDVLERVEQRRRDQAAQGDQAVQDDQAAG